MNKYSSPKLEYTGVKYPSLGIGQESSEAVLYSPDGKVEKYYMLELHQSVQFMVDKLRPYPPAISMLAECMKLGVMCHTVLQIYVFPSHIGVEGVIYISGMKYGNTRNEFSRYFRNGELAWSSYRVLGNPSQFPQAGTKEFFDAIKRTTGDPFQVEYYIYSGKYSINGVSYEDFFYPKPVTPPRPLEPPQPKPNYPKPSALTNCSPSDKNWRGNNPVYQFCVAEDLHYVNIAHAPSVQFYKQGTDKWFVLQWNIYGINGIKLKAERNWQILECSTRGADVNGFSIDVVGNDNHTFNIKDFKKGLYKFELYVLDKSNIWRGHNEVFICID
jgi:hypothetical protein